MDEKQENIYKAINIAKQYNQGLGTIKELAKNAGMSDRTFYRNIKEVGIYRDKKTNKYIIPKNILENAEGERKNMQDKQVNKENIKKKKKTFEISEDVEKAVKIQAATEEKTINQWVDDTLRKNISDEVWQLLKK